MGYYKDVEEHSKKGSNIDYDSDRDEVVGIGVWIGILILTAIPLVNFIGLIIMALSQGNKNISNYAKASLIIIAIPMTLFILLKACS